ncbi:MAG: fasciclin domain-containing protein [Deltaproteobacteria bacterium]|nr:fasciclin domain-containing protein [Deltaproteobacteria bacterium]
MTALKALISTALAAAFLLAAPASTFAQPSNNSTGTVLDVLTATDGAQAVVAAVLVVDQAGVLDFSLAELLGDRKSQVILLAPSNSAFENLLGLDPGALDGLSVEQVVDALPGLLPEGVGAEEVAAILLKHASLPQRANNRTASESALLANGFIEVADGSELPVSIGGAGVKVNYEATIVAPDFRARNGFVHFIDAVILDGLL